VVAKPQLRFENERWTAVNDDPVHARSHASSV
jgi:hypothetical protein